MFGRGKGGPTQGINPADPSRIGSSEISCPFSKILLAFQSQLKAQVLQETLPLFSPNSYFPAVDEAWCFVLPNALWTSVLTVLMWFCLWFQVPLILTEQPHIVLGLFTSVSHVIKP